MMTNKSIQISSQWFCHNPYSGTELTCVAPLSTTTPTPTYYPDLQPCQTGLCDPAPSPNKHLCTSAQPLAQTEPQSNFEEDEGPKVPLPPTLRGYAKFVVVEEPLEENENETETEEEGANSGSKADAQGLRERERRRSGSRKPVKHSVGVRHLLDTSGARKLLRELTNNFFRRHRRHVTAPLCPHFHHVRLRLEREGAPGAAWCPAGKECPMIHVTRAGWAERREWFSPSSRDAERANSLEGDLAVEGRSLSEEAESPPSAGSSLGSESPDFKVSAAYTFTTTDPPSTDNESHNAQAKDISGLAEHAWQRYPGVFVRHRNEAKMRSLLRREANSASKPSAI